MDPTLVKPTSSEGLWIAVRTGTSALTASATPDDIEYAESTVAHLHKGSFAPRTDRNLEADQGSLTIRIDVGDSHTNEMTELVIPDMSGEVWKTAAETNELAPERMVQLEGAVGALVFVRVLFPSEREASRLGHCRRTVGTSGGE